MKIIKNPSSSQRETNLIDLPIDIIIKILKILPVHTLFLFHFVCRLWRALLYSRQIACHIKQISDTKYKLMRNVDCSSWSRNEICRFKIPVELQSTEFMSLEPINGILCIIGPILSHVTYVYLWNPLTNEFKSVPRPSVQMGYVAIGFGFGFVDSTNDYRVVRVIKHEGKHDSHAEIYSLNRNSWRRVEDLRSSSEINGNEANRWSYMSHACAYRLRDGVLSVDLENEVIVEENYSKKHCRTVTWTDKGDAAILLTFPEDDLVLRPGSSGKSCHYSSPTAFDFSGSLVSLNRDHNDLG